MRKLIYRDDIALAMELRTWGAEWKQIGRGLGYHYESIRRAVRVAERGGYEATTVRGNYQGSIDTEGEAGGVGESPAAFAWAGRDVLAACLGAQA